MTVVVVVVVMTPPGSSRSKNHCIVTRTDARQGEPTTAAPVIALLAVLTIILEMMI